MAILLLAWRFLAIDRGLELVTTSASLDENTGMLMIGDPKATSGRGTSQVFSGLMKRQHELLVGHDIHFADPGPARIWEYLIVPFRRPSLCWRNNVMLGGSVESLMSPGHPFSHVIKIGTLFDSVVCFNNGGPNSP
jgi:hypothetical protein